MFNKISDCKKDGGEVKKVLNVLFFLKILHKITGNNKPIPKILSKSLDDFFGAKGNHLLKN